MIRRTQPPVAAGGDLPPEAEADVSLARPARFLDLRRFAAFFAAVTAALSLGLIFQYQGTQRSFAEGSVAPVTVKSPVNVPPFPSKALTRERQQEVAASVPEVLIADTDAPRRQQDHLRALEEWINQAREQGNQNPEPMQGYQTPSQATLAGVLALPPERWSLVFGELDRLVSASQYERTSPTQLPSLRAQMLQRANPGLNGNERAVLASLLELVLEPTLIVDREATAALREAAVRQVEPVLVSVPRGETVVRDGQIINALAMEKLQEAGLLEQKVRLPELAGSVLLMALMSAMLAIYLYMVQPPSISSTRRLVLLGVVLVLTVIAAKVALPGRPAWVFAFPIAAAPILLSVLLQLSLGLVGAVFLAVLCTYFADFSLDPLLALPVSSLDTLGKLVLYLATGIIAAILVGRASRTLQYFVASTAATVAGCLVVGAFWLLNPDRDATALPWQLLSVGAGNTVASALAIGFTAALGLMFDVTTRMHLQELGQTDHPLLRRLLQEAPGTYYHSLLVGNLAEQAAAAVRADALLARVGAYYHDIGKLKNPGCFIENQRRGENIHDRIDPYTSAKMIIAHVPDGVALAEQHKLPKQVMAFIKEHHGCRITAAFYNKATHLYPEVHTDDFRYPGPPPQTRETAIVMLADSVEAMSRSEETTRPEELDRVVDTVFAERLAEGELNQCDLTLRDIERVKQVFKTGLRGMYHPRVRYPLPAELTAISRPPADPDYARSEPRR